MTSGSRVNWRKIAEDLASRLQPHAFCDQHPEGAGPVDCSFCQDRRAYRNYLAAGGRDQAPRVPPGRPVPLADVPPSDHFLWAGERLDRSKGR